MTDISPDAAEAQAHTLLALEPSVLACWYCLNAGRYPVDARIRSHPSAPRVKSTMCDEHADALSAWWDAEAARR